MSATYTHTETQDLLIRNHGTVILLDGIKHTLSVSTYWAIYPYAHEVITAHAEPKDKRSEYYRRTREELGDDWSTDLLDSDVTVLADVLAQLS
jgi:hypothetical protein